MKIKYSRAVTKIIYIIIEGTKGGQDLNPGGHHKLGTVSPEGPGLFNFHLTLRLWAPFIALPCEVMVEPKCTL